MEEFKWISYILLAVIILVVRMWLKAFQSPKPSATNQPTTSRTYPVPVPPATSYQDILKEMQSSSERAKKANNPTSLESFGSQEKVKREARSLEKTETPARSLEKISPLAKEKTKKPSAIELARQNKPRPSVVQTPSVNYGKLLQDPQNMRAALILSEILNRPYKD